ncbi:MAG TPA: helix-turn-helix domain-containing protein [Miltoncostaeaceae bacterium]|nr:helix-turn-helix domain-containing protein [Miltoncostaeaceae bacterium]
MTSATTPEPAASTVADGLSPQEAEALAHPSRERIAAALGRSPAGLTVADLATEVGLHQNAVRQHLRVLARVGVVSAAPAAPTGRRGRPSVRYALAAPHGVSAVGHRELVRSLLEIIRVMGVDEESIRAFGREQGHNPDGISPGAGVAGLRAVLAGLGFAPEEVGLAADRMAGETDIRLRSCPFRDAVLAPGGELICALHHGLVEGTIDRLAPTARLAIFEPHHPAEGRCRVVVNEEPAGASGRAGGARS